MEMTWKSVRCTYREQQTLALLVGPAAAQEPHQYQHGPNGDAEKAHVDELHALPGEGPQQVQEGATVHAHPDAHGEQGQAPELQEERGKNTIRAKTQSVCCRVCATVSSAERVIHT